MRSAISTIGTLILTAGLSVALPSGANGSPLGRACACVSGGGARLTAPLGGWIEPAFGGRDAYRVAPAVAKGKLFVANELEGNVAIIDAVTKTVRKVQLGYKIPNTDYEMVFTPRGLVVAPDGQSVWVTAPIPQSDCAGGEGGGLCEGPNLPPGAKEEVVVFDPRTDTIVKRISVPSLDGQGVHLTGVVIDPESRYAYIVANGASQIVRVDVQTRELAGRVDLGANRDPQSIGVCGDKLVIANGAGRSLSVVEISRGTAEEIPLGGVATRAVCSQDGEAAYVAIYETREVVRYEFATGAITRMALPAGTIGPSQVALSPDGKKLYVADEGILMGRAPSDKLYELDAMTGALRATMTVGRAPRGLALSDDGKTAYTTNLYDANISIVDLVAHKLVTNVATGTAPLGIGVWTGVPLVQ